MMARGSGTPDTAGSYSSNLSSSEGRTVSLCRDGLRSGDEEAEDRDEQDQRRVEPGIELGEPRAPHRLEEAHVVKFADCTDKKSKADENRAEREEAHRQGGPDQPRSACRDIGTD